MGYYSEYLEMGLDFDGICKLRKKQLRKIGEIRNRPTLVYAADLNKGQAPITMNFDDLMPVNDQISNLKSGQDIDLIIETPGGDGTIAENIVRTIHDQFKDVGILIPGTAMSAGTIVAMSGDEIMMHRNKSSLGPIDAQLSWNGKTFSAHAFLEGIEEIKCEAAQKKGLSLAYVPILQNISPGEITHAQNAQDFSRQLVQDWLVKYKFRHWDTHKSTGKPVTDDEKAQRAEEISRELCNHGRWKSHGRRIRLSDLEDLRLKITDYSADGLSDLCEALDRYYVLLQLTMAHSGVYKIIETADSQIMKHVNVSSVQNSQPAANLTVPCPCGRVSEIQANFDQDQPLQADKCEYPADDKFRCPGCGTEHDLSSIRLEIEAKTQRRILR